MFLFDANLLCLDFLNTRIVRDGEPVDLLPDVERLRRWFDEAAGVHDVEGLTGTGEQWQDAGEEVHTAALELREAIGTIADRAIQGRAPRLSAVGVINDASRRGPVAPTTRPAAHGWVARDEPASPGPQAALAAVARSAIALIVDLDPARVGRCDGDACVLYYYDTTRNRSRRWCSMERCGNRAKVAAHYRRQRNR